MKRTIERLLKKYGIGAEDGIGVLMEMGVKELKGVRDVFHGTGHVEAILANLEKLIVQGGVKVEKEKLEDLVVAICWHDVWKSKRLPYWPWDYLINNIWDGKGSAEIFWKKSQDVIDKRRRKQIYRLIYNHAPVFPWGERTKANSELTILRDLDRLERWNKKRMTIWKVRFRKDFRFLGEKLAEKIIGIIFDWYLPKLDGEKKYVFGWSKRKYQQMTAKRG